ncbi:rabenosyn-5 [Protopterus annectens]|uniref:rabenosyn-5 n=1 Tax=Protopterus annectens TaxID=7888 RepID=UPI001CFA57E8|nr:rabenosyn-5 [Protopterus annectens]
MYTSMMASSYPPPFEDQGEMREGFLCPLCLKDLQSFYQLQSHYEEEHSGDDRDVKGHLKSLVQKAKKARNKLLNWDGEDRTESGGQYQYESFSYGGVDPYMWDPQEPGAMRSHLNNFKKHRAARIDRSIIEVNKLIIRLEKLTSFDRTSTDSAKVRAIEKSVVPWVSDHDVPFCPDCGNKFSIRNRRHHCRLCGSIMCRKCTELLGLPFAQKLTSAAKEVLSFQSSPHHSPNSSQLSRRGSVSSLSSVSSVLEEKEDDRIRCCRHCMSILLKRERQIDEKDHIPDIVKLYEKLRLCMEKADQKAPEYIKMAESLNAGETTYQLENASSLRLEVQKLYELIDALSKKILTLGINEEPKPHPKSLQLQRMIRYSATLFVQEKLLGLTSLPTKEKYEELKEKRKQEIEKKLQLERQAAQKRKLDEKQKDSFARPSTTTNGDLPSRTVVIKKAEGWLPSSTLPQSTENSDPLLQQISNIKCFIKQAKEASRTDEVNMLKENLRQLQDEYDQQQTQLAIELSKKEAEEEAFQRQQFDVLHEQQKRMSLHLRARSLDFREVKHCQQTVKEMHNQIAYQLDLDTTQRKHSPVYEVQSPKSVEHKSGKQVPFTFSTNQESYQSSKQIKKVSSLNPFEDEDDSSNPFAEESSSASLINDVATEKKDYNPFDEEEEDQVGKTDTAKALNPFEGAESPVDSSHTFQNSVAPSKAVLSTNPFDTDTDLINEESIEEELLLQQIDNIRAYIFDAKCNGRMDEVELLTANLRELQHTLAEQKQKTM